jgi:thiol-disulfide isomerase/thioredoxin
MTIVSLFIVLIVSLVAISSAVIKEYTQENFDEILHDDKVFIIKFYSPMCGTCKEFAPVWEKFTRTLGDQVEYGAVNIEAEGMGQLADSMGVLDEGIPNVRIITRKKKKMLYKTPSIYSGQGKSMPHVAKLVNLSMRVLQQHQRDDEGNYMKHKTGHPSMHNEL